VAAVVVLAVGVLAAWAVHALWLGNPSGGPPPSARDLMRHGRDEDRRRSPQSLVDDPLAEVGMKVLTDANAPLASPEALRRTFAMETRGGARTFRYEGELSVDEAAGHYRTELSRAEYKLVRDASMRHGGRILVGEKRGRSLEVTLRKRGKKSKLLQVYVIVRGTAADQPR
jgi:hypothetical protein